MTASLPQEVREAFGGFITCEYTTIDSRQQPIVWPVTPYYENGGAVIDVTTGLGYPKKADDARRNPHVALLFSDPTGSGIDSGIKVLVQGTADVDDRDLTANRERYWRESGEKLPATKEMHPPKFIRGLFDWYYTRIYVHVRPERVFVWPGGDVTSPPRSSTAHMDEVRSGHIEEPLEPHAPETGGGVAWDERIEELGRSATRPPCSPGSAPDGFPLAVRLPVEPRPRRAPDRARRRARPGCRCTPGPRVRHRARHSPDFTWQENFQVRGDLVAGRRRLGARAAQAGRGLRASGRERGRPLPAQPLQVDPLLQDRPALPQERRRSERRRTQVCGKGSRPACHGPAG